jgi:hypothetical protein
MATGTNGRRTLAWTHGDFDTFVIGSEAGMLVNEAPEMMAAVLNCDELQHGKEGSSGRENYQDNRAPASSS